MESTYSNLQLYSITHCPFYVIFSQNASSMYIMKHVKCEGLSSRMWCLVAIWLVTDVSEEHTASIIRLEYADSTFLWEVSNALPHYTASHS
jgi:hypothetical protein